MPARSAAASAPSSPGSLAASRLAVTAGPVVPAGAVSAGSGSLGQAAGVREEAVTDPAGVVTAPTAGRGSLVVGGVERSASGEAQAVWLRSGSGPGRPADRLGSGGGSVASTRATLGSRDASASGRREVVDDCRACGRPFQDAATFLLDPEEPDEPDPAEPDEPDPAEPYDDDPAEPDDDDPDDDDPDDDDPDDDDPDDDVLDAEEPVDEPEPPESEEDDDAAFCSPLPLSFPSLAPAAFGFSRLSVR